MSLKALIPPCYNEGDEHTTVVVEQPKKLDIKALEMFVRLSNAVNSNNVFCVPDADSDDVIMIILNNTKINAIEQCLMDTFLEISTSIKIKGVIKEGIVLNYFVDKSKPNRPSFTRITIDDLDTSNMTTCSYMFHSQEITELDLHNFNTSNVTDMSGMFNECNSLQVLNLSNFDTHNVTDMCHMFSNCSTLQKLDLSNFDTSNVTSMSAMFKDCKSLTELSLNNFDTSKVIDMFHMFSNCISLQKIDLSSFNTSNIHDINSMFSNCTSLKELNLSNFDTSKVETMRYMFENCVNLSSLDLSNFDTRNTLDMIGMFSGCKKLKNINLSNFNFYNTRWINEMFANCRNLISLDLSNVDLSLIYTMAGMFKNCKKLETIQLNIPKTNELYMNEMFYGCTSLKSVSFLVNVDATYIDVEDMFKNAVIQELSLENFIASASPHMFNKTTVMLLNLKNANFDNVKAESVKTDISSVFRGSIFHKVQISKSNERLIRYFKRHKNRGGSQPIIEIV